MLRYILNVIKSFNVVCINADALESILLSGDIFENVMLTEDSIQDTFIALNYFCRTKQNIKYEYKDEQNDNIDNTFRKHEYEK